MKLLTTPKTAYLLEAGLEVFHGQSNEWLNEIAFWKDESAFLFTLIVKKHLNQFQLMQKIVLKR